VVGAGEPPAVADGTAQNDQPRASAVIETSRADE